MNQFLHSEKNTKKRKKKVDEKTFVYVRVGFVVVVCYYLRFSFLSSPFESPHRLS